MPVPLPADADARLGPPTDEEVRAVSGALATAVASDGGLTDLQRLVLRSVTRSMTGYDGDPADADPVGPEQLARTLVDRPAIFRRRILQVMILGELLLRPIPRAVVDRVQAYADELSVGDDMLDVSRRFADGALGLALFDFRRSGYEGDWASERTEVLHTSRTLGGAWDEVPDDPGLAARWEALEHCPPGSLGRRVFEFYLARGFHWPGTPGSAPPLLAQHDWVHVLADYGSTVENEIEVFSFISRANDDPRAFSLQASVLSLFETGYLPTGMGLFESDSGHLSADAERMAVRLADAMYRGAVCNAEQDLLSMDWFAVADEALDDVRRALHVVPKSTEAWEAGSVGPWERGGISPYQADYGRARAAAADRPYLAFGAAPT